MVCMRQRRVDRPAVQSVQGLVRLVVGHAKFTREKGTCTGDNISLRRLFVVWLAVIAGPHVFAPCPPTNWYMGRIIAPALSYLRVFRRRNAWYTSLTRGYTTIPCLSDPIFSTVKTLILPQSLDPADLSLKIWRLLSWSEAALFYSARIAKSSPLFRIQNVKETFSLDLTIISELQRYRYSN